LKNGESLPSQELLFPESFEIPAFLIPIIEAEKENLKRLGFYLEPFGGNTWRLRGIPAHLKINAAAKAIITYLQNENESRETDIFKKNALSYANSSAIQNDTELSQQEMNQIISDLLSLPNPYQTPKGEAVFMKMQLEDIKRKF
jgi:DNA mismatch repair protein MutL